MAKGDDDKSTGSVRDVEAYMNQIKTLIKQYRILVEKLDAIKKDKKKALDRMELINQRQTLKDQFIAKKQAARANIKLLKQGLDILKERELRDLQEEYREVDADFKALGVVVEKDSLLEGAKGLRGDRFDPTRAKNDDLLDKALTTQQKTTQQLKQGLMTVETTKEQAKYTAANMEQDREKLKRIDQGLDEVQSELELSRVLMTRFIKRLYTDKVVIAFAFLLVAGLAGIVTYSVLNPDQKIFNVPDIVKPNMIPGVSPSPSATPSWTPTGTPTPSWTPTGTPTPSETPTPSSSPSASHP